MHVEPNSYVFEAGYEEITGVVALGPRELEQWIAEGRINDGFTLAAWTLFKAKAVLPYA